MSFMSIRYKRI